MEPVRQALQEILDQAGDGWQLSHFVVAVGLERVTTEGVVETTPWWLAPKGQA